MFTPQYDPAVSGITAFNLRAAPLFERARFYGSVHCAAARLLRRSWRLPMLDDHAAPDSALAVHQIDAIPLERIYGSVNRSEDFERHFYPVSDRLATRWARIASMMLQETPLPPVELVQVAATYYVVDGHHRISVARMLHYATVDALITAVYAAKG